MKRLNSTVMTTLAIAAMTAVVVASTSAATSATSDLERGWVGTENVFDRGASWRAYQDSLAAMHSAIENCMAARNLTYQHVSTQVGPPDFTDALADAGLSSEEFAGDWGFGISTAFTEIQEPEIEEQQSDVPARFDGIPEECVGEGVSAMPPPPSAETAKRVEQAQDAFAMDPALIAFYSDWSSCMAERGYEATSPFGLAEAIEDQLRTVFEEQGMGLEELHSFELGAGAAAVKCGGDVRDLLIDDAFGAEWGRVARAHGLE